MKLEDRILAYLAEHGEASSLEIWHGIRGPDPAFWYTLESLHEVLIDLLNAGRIDCRTESAPDRHTRMRSLYRKR